MVLATCRRCLPSDADAQDATQETFLKLARAAGDVRSNVGAWLHACAARTALDLLRRGRSRREAHAALAEHARSLVDHPARMHGDEPAWQDLAPVLDQALAELPEDERELIVARFLLGARQSDMAEQQGVHKGTMSRRLDRALRNLRTILQAKGLVISGTAGLAVLLGQATTPVAGAAVTASLMQVGLCAMTTGSGAAATTSTSAIGASSLKGTLLLTVLGLLLTGGGALAIGKLATAPEQSPPKASPAAPAQGASTPTGAFDRPDKALTGFALMQYDDLFALPRAQITIADDLLRFDMPKAADGRQVFIHLRVQSAKDKGQTGTLATRVEKANVPSVPMWDDLLGKDLPVEYRVLDGAIELTPRFPDAPPWNPTMRLVRKPGEAKRASAGVHTPASLAGAYQDIQPWNLQLDKEHIKITSGDELIAHFIILDWSTAADHARVQVLCKACQSDNILIGKRIKLLVRRDERGITIAMPTPINEQLNGINPRLDEWPTSFKASKTERHRVMRFSTAE